MSGKAYFAAHTLPADWEAAIAAEDRAASAADGDEDGDEDGAADARDGVAVDENLFAEEDDDGLSDLDSDDDDGEGDDDDNGSDNGKR